MKRKLQAIAAQAENRRMSLLDFGGMSWLRPAGDVTLPGPAALELREYAPSIVEKYGWGDKFSAQFVLNRIVPIVLAMHDGDEEGADRLLAEMIETIESFDTEQTVYLPVSGVRVEVPEFRIGEVVLRDADAGLLDELRARLAAMRTTPPAGQEPDEAGRPDDTASKLAGKAVSVYRVVAEPIRAAERAEDATRRALGMLTFCHAALYLSHEAGDAVVGLDGEIPTLRPWVGMLSNDGFHESISVHPFSWPIEITERHVRQMDYFGLSELSRLLAKPSAELSEMEQALLRAVDWFAQSQAQATPANRLLNLITCLETLVGPKDGVAITRTVAERTALILLGDYEKRRKLKQAIAAWYDTRSGLTHGDADIVSELTAKAVRPYVIELVRFLLARRHDLPDKNALEAWFDRSRLGGRIPSTGTTRTIAELREERGWSQVELADRAKKEPRTIDWWERTGPDIEALRLLSDLFGMAPETITLAPHNRLINVRGRRILLTARQGVGDIWTAKWGGHYVVDDDLLPQPNLDAEEPDDDPLGGWTGWRSTGGTEREALDALEGRISSAMAAAYAKATRANR